jgi:transcription termination factor Rho
LSVDSQPLERAALERKDREELHTIANALGSKPGSRARKAELVDLILELTGVSTTPAQKTESTQPDEPEKPVQAAKSAKADAEARDAGSSDEPQPDARPEAGQPSNGTSNGDGDRARSQSQRQQGGRQQGDGKQGDGKQGDGKQGQRPQGDGNQGGQQGQRQQGDGKQGGQQGQRPQGGQRDDQEPGNRRRRRRGRDRDAPPEEFQGEPIDVSGILDMRDEGYGFLRVKGYLPSKDDVYVSVKQARQFGMRRGDILTGGSRPANRSEKNPALLRVDTINGKDPEQAKARPRFEDRTPLFPDEKLRLEVDGDTGNMTARIVDLISPIGKGQRGLIVSPPKAGKTTVMKTIARSIETNNPECHVIVLLVDERPEEVTDFRRWLKRGEVVASTFDRPSDEHTMVAELVIERAKRLVEEGQDVVIVLDGITRLARAYNLSAPASGRIMSGGIDAGALYPPKRFFGAARNLEEGGSLTILASALVETNSKMDEHIFEEFKGTGNMELKLDRRLAERRIYPAIDVDASSTRHEELLFDRKQLQMVWKLRRVLTGLASEGSSGAGLEMLTDRLSTFRSNDEFLAEIAKGPAGA